MKSGKSHHIFWIVTWILWFPNVGLAQRLEIKTDSAKATFIYTNNEVEGSIPAVQVHLNFDPDSLEAFYLVGSASVELLSTDNKMRDRHLKSDEFFDVIRFPLMTFTSGKIVERDEQYFVTGILKIRDVEKEETFKMEITDREILFKTVIFALDYQVSPSKKREKSKVRVEVMIPR